MIEIPLSRAMHIISPRLTVLVNTLDGNGCLNSAPYGWIYPLSFNPPLVGVGIGGKHKHTYINSKKTGEFVICVVSEDFGQQAVDCEERHESRENLLEKHGLHTEASMKVKVPRVREAKAILECKMRQFVELEGDHSILVGEVVYAEAEGEGGEPDLDKIRPLLHHGGEKFRKIGREIILKRRL